MSGFFQVFYAIFSGILTALAIPNEIFHFGSPFFGMVALCPLYIAAKEARSYKNAAAIFAADALSAHLLSSFWLANFKDFAIFTLGASAIGTACIEASAGCVFFAAAGGLKKTPAIKNCSDCGDKIFPAFSFACVRVIYEWAKSTGFLAYPWGTLSMSVFRLKPLLQSADIFGVYGITFLFAFFSAAIGELTIESGRQNFFKNEKSQFAQNKKSISKKISHDFCFAVLNFKFLILNSPLLKCSLFMFLCLLLYGAARLLEGRPPQKILNAVLVQQNRDPWADKDDIESMKISIGLSQKGICEFALRGEKADIVVWSEAVLRRRFPDSYAYYALFPENEPLVSFIKKTQTPFLIGGSYVINEEKRQHANAALMFDKEGLFRGYYGKTHLVPFAEVIPGVEYPFVKKFMQKVVGFSNGWHPGNEFTLFDLKINSSCKKNFPSFNIIDLENPPNENQKNQKVRVATPICFEDAFPDICGPFHKAGAEVFLNLTDDAWSKTASAEYQHFVVAAFRAVEYRTTLVRSTNAGFSCVVDPCGRILQAAPIFEQTFLAASVPIYKWRSTVYSQHTNWFVHLILAFVGCVLFCEGAKSIREERAIKKMNAKMRDEEDAARADTANANAEKTNAARAKAKITLKESVQAAISEIEF